VRLTAVIVVAVAAAILIWLLMRGNSASNTPPVKKSVAAVSEQGLKTLAASLPGQIFWKGPQPGTTYELTQTSTGREFVRYLPAGTKVGTGQRYPFVATFPFSNAFAATQAVASKPSSVKVAAGPNAVAFYSRSLPTNVYLAFRGSNYQIEVFDTNAARAQQLVAHGQIAAVSPRASAPTVTSASLANLKALPTQLHHQVYWAGTQTGTKYELTRTANGRVFVRYLPSGAKLGTSSKYLFVGTLPLPNSYAATKKVAQRPGSVSIPVGGGAVAFYSRSLPTNVYLAYPGSAYQIEVFAPDAKQARALVSAGNIRPIP
jgi:hypothetical protein